MTTNKNTLGILFIVAGVAWGALVFDKVYDSTLGFLVQHHWLQPPVAGRNPNAVFGKKPIIIFYSLTLIAIGVFILWTRET